MAILLNVSPRLDHLVTMTSKSQGKKNAMVWFFVAVVENQYCALLLLTMDAKIL